MAGRINPIGASALSPRSYGGESALGGYFEAERAASDSMNRFMRQRADIRAGRAMNRGDRQGAAAEYYEAGLVPEGSGVEAYDRNMAVSDMAISREQSQERAKLLTQVAQALKTVPMDARKSQLDRMLPIFQQVGMDTSLFDQVGAEHLDDASLDAFSGQVEQELSVLGNLEDGLIAVDKGALRRDPTSTSAVRVLREPTRDPLKQQLLEAQIAATRSLGGQRDAAADKARRPPASGGRGSSAGSTGLPAGFTLD